MAIAAMAAVAALRIASLTACPAAFLATVVSTAISVNL